MPGFLLHVGAVVQCAHGGMATPTVPNPRVLVSGQPTVMQPGPWVIAGCANPPPIASNGPCVTGMWITGTTRVFSNGMPLVVNAAASVTVLSGTPMIPSVFQMRVQAT